MTRSWKSFNTDTTNKEFASLPKSDRVDLFEAMKLYRQDAGIGYLVKNYGDGLWMIKPQHGQGRCLFFMIAKSTESTELIALLAYKKESRKAPDRLLALAKQRMDGYLRDQK